MKRYPLPAVVWWPLLILDVGSATGQILSSGFGQWWLLAWLWNATVLVLVSPYPAQKDGS